jgi:RHS repeat-associated protein
MGKGRAMDRVLRKVSGWLLVLLAFTIVGARPVLAQDAPITFTPTADAYVLDGAWAGSNFGTDIALYTRTSNGQNYDSYLKFNTSGVGSVLSAKLRINASVSANANIGLTVHSVAATGWSESAITWNNKPTRGGALGSVTVTGTSFAYYEIDVTSYLAAEKAAGRNVVSFALHNGQSSNQFVWMRSREAGSNPPQLVITPKVTVVSLLPALSTVTLGASTNLMLTISSAQTSDTVVPIAASPAGIVVVPEQVTVPAGQTQVPVPVGTLALGQAGITASLNGSSASAGVNVVAPPVALTGLEPATFTMTVGAISTFTVRINAAQIGDTEIALVASNPSVLQVPASVIVPQGMTSATFTATGLEVGDSTITASANGTSKVSSVHVSPQAAAIVSLLPTPLPLQQGATGQLTVTINVAQEVPTTIALTNSAPEVATAPESVVIAAGAISALVPVTAVSPGSAVITASVNETSAAATVEVTPPPPVVSLLEPAALSLPKGTPGTLRVTVSRAPSAVTPIALTSSDPSIASVPPQVNIPAGALFAEFPVMPNAPGQAIVTASLNGGSASSTITVGPAELATLSVSPQTPTRYAGETVTFSATGTMTDGTSEDFTSRVTWSSSNTSIATIAATGVATAHAAGETTIRAAFTFTAVQTGQSVTIEQSTALTVKAPTPLVLSAPATTLIEGNSVTVTVTTSDPAPAGGVLVNLSGGGTGAGTFPASVTISQTSATFLFTAIAPGSYTLTATAQNRLPGSVTFSIQPLLAITAVTPASAQVGAIITLVGTGFDPVPGNNTLVFRGTNNTLVGAPVLTATPTQITVRVPPLAETGPITLTNSRGIVQSPPFTVVREQDFQLVVSPTALTVYQGSSNAAQAQLSSIGTRSFTGLVTLSVQGLPAGVSASFAPAATLSAFQPGTVTLTATSGAAPGNYALTVQATFSEGGVAFVRSSALTLTVAASTGVTGVKGRFVTPEGNGIGGVIVRADIQTNPQPQTTTDAAGNFVLAGLPAGAVTFRFDATPANPLYPIWPYTMTVVANQVAVVPDWTINPPPSDDKFVAIANATQDQSITDARFPGLAIKLPAGVTITGWDGVLKSRIAVERIMPDQLPVSAPPFSMREAYQLYFGTPMGGIPSQPIPVTLPNVAEREPGEQVEMWFFDGSPMGGSGEWKLAGMGTVSADGKTVASNPGVGIPRFCGVCGLLSLNCPPPPNPPPPGGGGCSGGNPVDLFSGQELPTTGGLKCGGVTPIDTGLNYHPVDSFNNRAGTVASFGFGWVSDYDIAFLPFEGPQKRLVMPGSKWVNFVDDGSGSYRSFDDPTFDGAVITATNAATHEWQLKFKSGVTWRFKPFPGVTGLIRGGPPTFVTEMTDSSGNLLSIARHANGRISAIGSPARFVTMTYGANGFVSDIRDSANRLMQFTYNAENRIETITDADGKVTRYTYVGDDEIAQDAVCGAQPTAGSRIKSVLYPGRTTPTTNFHGSSRRVLRQTAFDGGESRFAYKVTGACVTHVANPGVKCTTNCPDTDSWDNFQAGWRFHGGRVTATTVTQPGGNTYTHTFNTKGWPQQSTDTSGQRTKSKYDSANRLVERTDAIGRIWKYQYDEKGNIAQEIDPVNRVVHYSYDGQWNRVNAITRFMEDNTPIVVRYAFHATTGNPIRTTDPMDRITSYAYTSRGQLSAVTLPGNRISTLEYNAAGDLARTVNALGNEALIETDGAGRAVKVTDPLGFDTRTEYNGVNQVTKVIDALLQESRVTYDPAQRVASVIDPRNIAIRSFQYDNGDRLTAATDALNKSETIEYDLAGRIRQVTDRKGQATTFEYDQSGRITRVVFPDATRSYFYDAVGRLGEIREGSNTVAYVYDAADRVVHVITDSPAGRHDVGYEYDALDRVTRRTVNGADPTVYTYDKASQLTSLSYRNQVTTYEREPSSGRLTRKTLPNGIKQVFAYDDADRVLSITYQKPDDSVIETVTYSYDAKGQRRTRSWGSASLGETPFTATYDAAGRMASITLTATNQSFTLLYDDNGNVVSKTETANPSNVTTYTWDSRNRLTAISAPGIAAHFSYDALGRRAEKTVNGQTIGFVYDGAQAIGEVTAGTISTAMLTGLAIDEVIARYSQTGNTTYLTDALGSVIAQTKDDQSLQNFYGYSAYGESQTLGTDDGNPIQYTGRENDNTGLLYYRARYYDPVLKRFISEDPLGLVAGTNLYTYVDGNPINLIDPTGNKSTCYSAGPNCSGAGPGNSPGGTIYKTPPSGECLKAVWRGGYIVKWEPCKPKCPDPTKPDQNPPPKPPTPNPGWAGVPSLGPWIGDPVTINWNTFFPTQQKGGAGRCMGGVLAEAAGWHIGIEAAAKGAEKAGATAVAKKLGPIGWAWSTWEVSFGIPTCLLDSVSTVPNPDFKPQ